MDNFHFNIKHPFSLYSLLGIFFSMVIRYNLFMFLLIYGGFGLLSNTEFFWVRVFNWGGLEPVVWGHLGFWVGALYFSPGLFFFFVYVVCFLCLMFNFPGLSSPQLHKLLFKSFLWAFSYPYTFKKTSLNKWINILPAANDLSTNYKGSCLS